MIIIRLKLIDYICLTIVTAAFTFVTVEIGMLAMTIRDKINPLEDDVHRTIHNTDIVMTRAGDVLEKAAIVEDKVSTAADSQVSSWKRIDNEVAKTVADIHDITIHTDMSLNGTHNHPEIGLLPSVTKTINTMDDTIIHVNTTIDDVQPAIKSVVAAAAAVQMAMENPDIVATMDNIKQTAINVNTTSGNVAAATGDIKLYVHRETAPIRGTWNLIKSLLGLTWQARGAIAR